MRPGVVVTERSARVVDVVGLWTRSRSPLLVTSYVLLPRRPPFDLGQPPPLQLGQLVIARRDHEVVGVALPDVEPERRGEQARDARAGRRCEPRDPDAVGHLAPSGLRLVDDVPKKLH